jgi:hypothetical protein
LAGWVSFSYLDACVWKFSEEAILKAQALALRVLAEKIDNGAVSSIPLTISFLAA